MGKYKISFDRIMFTNLWTYENRYNRSDWLILGVAKWWFSSSQFEYRISFFGLMIRVWLTRKFIEK